jgi:hypothetical protein
MIRPSAFFVAMVSLIFITIVLTIAIYHATQCEYLVGYYLCR